MSPDGPLTPTQYEILEAVWATGSDGITIAEIWQQVSERRSVARTTILNLVDRLEKRGWLKRHAAEGANRFTAAVSRDRTHASLAGEFVDDYFGGSASALVMSLLGTGRLSAEELRQLRSLLNSPRERGRKEDGR